MVVNVYRHLDQSSPKVLRFVLKLIVLLLVFDYYVKCLRYRHVHVVAGPGRILSYVPIWQAYLLVNHCVASFFSIRARGRMYVNSLRILDDLCPDISSANQGKKCVWSLGPENHTGEFRICLCLAAGSAAEGALAMELTVNHKLIHRVSFSVFNGANGGGGFYLNAHSILIGGNQGYGPRELHKFFAKSFYDVSPEDALLVAVKSVAKAAHLRNIYGVSSDFHSLALVCGAKFDSAYKDFWVRNDGVDVGGVYLLPNEPCRGVNSPPNGRNKQRKLRRREQIKALMTSIVDSLMESKK